MDYDGGGSCADVVPTSLLLNLRLVVTYLGTTPFYLSSLSMMMVVVKRNEMGWCVVNSGR